MNSFLDDFKLAFKTGNVLNQIIIINVVVFLFYLILELILGLSDQDLLLLDIKSVSSFDPRLNEVLYKPWSIITYGFTHFDFFHILFNMLGLYWFGRIIAEYLGQFKLLGVYIWGVVGGALLYILLYNLFPRLEILGGLNPAMIGASAGVYAVVVGAATFQPDFSIRLLLFGSVRLKYVALFFIILSLSRVMGDNSGGNIAHLGGALVGFLSIKQLQQGNDWSKPIVSIITWVKSLFKPQPKIKVSYKNTSRNTTSSKTTSRTERKAASKSKSTQEEIDAILDKISEKGYDALTKEEKKRLFDASSGER